MILTEITETIKLAIDGMRANKLRSFLASLGVVIGISFVILMGWVIKGLDNALEDTFKSIGQDMLWVDKWDWAGGRNWNKVRQRKPITYKQANELCKRLTLAELAIPTADKWGGIDVKYKSDHFQGLMVTGTKSEHALTSGGAIQMGRHFTQFEERSASNVVVMGSKAWETVFPEGNGLGETIKINGNKFLVIGVVKKQGTLLMDFIDNKMYIPFSSFMGMFGNTNRSISIGVKSSNINQLEEVREEVRGLMRGIRNLKPGDEDDFGINETKSFEDLVKTFRQWVWGIGIGMTILSFIVGIIGIMNIMFVSVTERTKEIGIRKAIGAKNRSILMQFLIEAATLSFSGAIIAFSICSALVFGIATVLPKYFPATSFLSPYLPYDLLIIATIVSVFVGMLAGLVPAMRAARLNPVDALRFE